jgi:uncharacterized protein
MDPQVEIFTAVEQGRTERVAELLRDHPELVNARHEAGHSLLLAAVYAGRKPVFELLLAQGAGVDLFEACALGLADRVTAHLDRDGELLHAYSHDGWTALHLAAFFGHREVARLLLERGAEVNARSRNTTFGRENTPLHAAAANRRTEVARLLIEAGADVNARDRSGLTPLALAAGTHNDLLMLDLLDKGARAS